MNSNLCSKCQKHQLACFQEYGMWDWTECCKTCFEHYDGGFVIFNDKRLKSEEYSYDENSDNGDIFDEHCCFKCGSSDHYANKCPQGPSKCNSKCNKCGIIGHYANQC